MYCTECGKQTADSARFCPFCGASLQSDEQQPESTDSAAIAPADLPQPTASTGGMTGHGVDAEPTVPVAAQPQQPPASAPTPVTPTPAEPAAGHQPSSSHVAVPPVAAAQPTAQPAEKKTGSGLTCLIIGCVVLFVLGLIAVGAAGYVFFKQAQNGPDAGVLGAIIGALQAGDTEVGGGDDSNTDGSVDRESRPLGDPDASGGDSSTATGVGEGSTVGRSGTGSADVGPLTEEGGAKVLHRFLKAMGQRDTAQMERLMAHSGVLPFDIDLLGQGDAVTHSYDVVKHERVHDRKYAYVVNERLKDFEGIEFTEVWRFTLEQMGGDWVITSITIDH